MEIVIKEDEKFLDLTGVPDVLKLRSGVRKYLYRRDCCGELPVTPRVHRVLAYLF